MLITFRKSICTWKQDLPYFISSHLTQRFLQQETNVTDSEWCTFGILLSTCTVHISLVWSNVIIKPKYYNWSIKSYIMGKLKSTKLCLFLCWISLTCAISQGNSQQFKSLITLICSKVFKPELFYIYRYISRKCKL